MKSRKVTKRLKATRTSLEEIRNDNRSYFEALAEKCGAEYAAEVESRYLQELANDLASVPEEEDVEVPMTRLEADSNNESD